MSNLARRVARLEAVAPAPPGPFAHLSDEDVLGELAAEGAAAIERGELPDEIRRAIEAAQAFARGEITLTECWERQRNLDAQFVCPAPHGGF
jgi:hypothetical protein